LFVLAVNDCSTVCLNYKRVCLYYKHVQVYVLTLEIKIAEIHDINLDINISNDDVYNFILILFVNMLDEWKFYNP